MNRSINIISQISWYFICCFIFPFVLPFRHRSLSPLLKIFRARQWGIAGSSVSKYKLWFGFELVLFIYRVYVLGIHSEKESF
ncbi:hypothetical protein BZA70DRAFT_277658 [Myxozyma melibiosi]|uniref:ATP synthase F0 subunit 8 n=1 Tax=Myxozyma melibiosi TaxID=54550 RepID=A0ABR1FA78_9ASCO